jgi:hypothetical protein
VKQSGSPKNIFIVVGLLALIYSMADMIVTFFIAVDYFIPPVEYQYHIINDPIGMGIVVGIPVFLLLLILERPPHKDN